MTPTNPLEQRHVQIRAAGTTARLLLDGHDVADHVRSYELRHTVGQLPEFQLLLRSNAAPEWEGTARVVGEAPDPGPAAAAFLAALDPGEIDRAVLARHDLLDGGPHEFTRALLAQLSEWALGVRQPGDHAAVDG
ncbi:hypothetical protein ACIG5E_30010 [Kitasatospora sp. NPDC053057]|uniref:hypothetical protein n=1 Tax=Kitasatospora sp. NPDC053057 TaxID=3364062 RepID=UPI0037CA10DC